MTTPRFKPSFHSCISEIPALDWNALALGQPPFMRHEFLAAQENTGCVGAKSGWRPCHLALRDENGTLVAAMPLYLKDHSWGEFVFDWAWADAYQRNGLNYYPKLVTASPFTPASANKILSAAAVPQRVIWDAVVEAIKELALSQQLSSWHIQFMAPNERDRASQQGMIIRKDCQFHWRNDGFDSFDHYLEIFSSAKRKKVRRERRRISEADISFEWLGGADIRANDWQDAYQLTRTTFLLRGNEPYLNQAFFEQASATLPDAFRVVFARHDGQRIAAAICLASETTLYGRYWGSIAQFNSLHFETCYYQGIEYCIQQGLMRFEPGTQGEHKVSRGFLPETTYSAHWLSDPRFADAIEAHLRHEAEHVEHYMTQIRDHSPFRSDGSDA